MEFADVNTGFGYYKNSQGYITDKCTLPIGKHPLTSGYTYFECATQGELDQIILTRPINEDKELKIKDVKILARKLIIDLIPEWSLINHIEKQRNALMRSSKLLRKEQKDTITAKEITELDALDALGDSITAIREASNSIEAEIEALIISEDVIPYDIVDNPLWP